MIWDLNRYGNDIAIEEKESAYSYNDLNDISQAIADNVKARSLVAVFTTNTIASLAGYIGFLNSDIVPMMLDSELNNELIKRIIEDYRPSYYWMPEKLKDVFEDEHVVYSALGYVLINACEDDPFDLDDDLALLITTSGSTGSPKFVRQTYRNIISNTEAIIDYLDIDKNEKAITTLPMNYVFGLSILNTHLYAGATVVLTEESCYTKAFWELLDTHKVTSFSGVPFVFEMLSKLRAFSKPFPYLKTITQAGGKLSEKMQIEYSEYAKDNGKRFIIMYGASEATARMGYLPFENAFEKNGSIGIAIPGGRYELIDANGDIIEEPDTTGELIYYGDNVTLGYAETGLDLSKGDENHGRLCTGDMAYRDKDGFYYIVGRRKRFLKMLGKRVNLDELEQLIKEEFSSFDVACAGEDDLLKIFVTDASIKNNVLDFIANLTSINRGLCKVSVIDEIPKSASGKVLYSKLNEL